MKVSRTNILLILPSVVVNGFSVPQLLQQPALFLKTNTKEPMTARRGSVLYNAATPSPDNNEQQQQVRRMVDDDEWDGVTMSLTDAVCQSVMESISTQTKTFIGKDGYNVGDITKQVDIRIKQAVANLRGKENYEIGDLVAYATEQGIAVAEHATGKKFDRVSDLSQSIDTRVKAAVKNYTGKETYEPGDLARAVKTTVKTRVAEFATTYELDQVAEEIIRKRKEWARKYLGEEFTEHFTWTQLANRITGKDTYEFGDVSKKVIAETKKYVDSMLSSKKNQKDSGITTATTSQNDDSASSATK